MNIKKWLPVNGFEARFEISNQGDILSINGKYLGRRLLSPCIDGCGYYVTNLINKNKKRNVRIHVLVAEHFLNKPFIKGVCVNHIDGNKLNNFFDNLEWTNISENIKHANKIGLINAHGENSSNSKIKDEQVYQIRHLSKMGFNNCYIKTMLNLPIGRRHIGDIIKRKSWKHI